MICHAESMILKNLDKSLRCILIRAEIVKSRPELEFGKSGKRPLPRPYTGPKCKSRRVFESGKSGKKPGATRTASGYRSKMLCHAQILSLRNLNNGLRRILIRAQIVKSRLEIESKKIWRKSRAASSSRPKLLSRAKSLRLESQDNNSRRIFIQAKMISRAKSLSLPSLANNSR